jgi:hypothetical protein
MASAMAQVPFSSTLFGTSQLDEISDPALLDLNQMETSYRETGTFITSTLLLC